MKCSILALTLAGALMLAGCGGGSKTATMSGGPAVGGGGTPTPTPTPGGGSGGGGTSDAGAVLTTLEQLPTSIDRMSSRQQEETSGFPGQSCDTAMSCQTLLKSRVAAATAPTGTMPRFQGTTTVQTQDGADVTVRFYAGWLNNSMFLAERAPIPESTSARPLSNGRLYWVRYLSIGRGDSTPVTGVYRGDAVDTLGNYGTSELNYAGEQLTLTINIPSYPVMTWPNIPVQNGTFDNGVRFGDNVLGPNKVVGWFYQGREVGGTFSWRQTLDPDSHTRGAFGAKMSGGSRTSGGDETVLASWEQLPTLIDRMDRRAHTRADDNPFRCDSTFLCGALLKSRLAAATAPTGTMRQFQGTTTDRTQDGVDVTVNFWGSWLDNSIAFVETAQHPELWPGPNGRRSQFLSLGRLDRNPMYGVYRGDAVDTWGNYGTSELNYVHEAGLGGQMGLTINFPNIDAMTWPNIPVENGRFDNGVRGADNVLGPNKVVGHFYQGGEVGGVFTWRRTLERGTRDDTRGAFGAKLTPDEP